MSSMINVSSWFRVGRLACPKLVFPVSLKEMFASMVSIR